MKYQATFAIDGGVSHGFGITYPDFYQRTKEFDADCHQTAYQTAMGLAEKLAEDVLSNPDTGFTKVQLLSLRGPEGGVSFDASKAVAQRITLEKLLSIQDSNKPLKEVNLNS